LRSNYSIEDIAGLERTANVFAILFLFETAEQQNNPNLLLLAENISAEFKEVYKNELLCRHHHPINHN
jgi:hypothetical protein